MANESWSRFFTAAEDLWSDRVSEAFPTLSQALVTLRPEMTPSLARMVLSLMRAETGVIAAVLPLKWFAIPQCWRFETTQRGRKREHYQWNMDMVGVPGVTAEAELLSAVVTFFERVGITSKALLCCCLWASRLPRICLRN